MLYKTLLCQIQHVYKVIFTYCQVKYNQAMDVKRFIKVRLAMKQMTMTELADKMTEISNKTYTRDSLNGKFYRGSISVNEMEIISKILDFTIEYKCKPVNY